MPRSRGWEAPKTARLAGGYRGRHGDDEEELHEFRSRQAKELHARGVFTPRNPGRKPNRPSAPQVIAARVSEEADEIATRLIELAKDGKPQDSLRAIDSLLKSESREQAREDREQDRLRSLSQDRLIAEVALRLRSMEEAGWTMAPPEELIVEHEPVRELSPPPEPTPPFVDD